MSTINTHVAQTYQTWEMVGEVFEENKKKYVNVVHPKHGTLKKVRWYDKPQGSAAAPSTVATVQTSAADSKLAPTQFPGWKQSLGFGEKGVIALFKGATYKHENWFHDTPQPRFHKLFGWYLPENQIEELYPIPHELSLVPLYWNEIADENNNIYKNEFIQEVVDSKLYDPSISEWIGNIGDRMELTITCTGAWVSENNYNGRSYLYTFVDADGNEFTWNTSSRILDVERTYTMRATIKEHKKWKNRKQTSLVNCRFN